MYCKSCIINNIS